MGLAFPKNVRSEHEPSRIGSHKKGHYEKRSGNS